MSWVPGPSPPPHGMVPQARWPASCKIKENQGKATKSNEKQGKASNVSTRACTHARQSTLSTAQHSSAQHSTALHSTAQHSTAQHTPTPQPQQGWSGVPSPLDSHTPQHSTHPPHDHRGEGEASPGGPLPWAGGGGALGPRTYMSLSILFIMHDIAYDIPQTSCS